jgi:hypothetical protein
MQTLTKQSVVQNNKKTKSSKLLFEARTTQGTSLFQNFLENRSHLQSYIPFLSLKFTSLEAISLTCQKHQIELKPKTEVLLTLTMYNDQIH